MIVLLFHINSLDSPNFTFSPYPSPLKLKFRNASHSICVICNRSLVGVNAAHPEGDGRRQPSHRRQEHGNDPFLSCRVAFKRRARQAGRQQQYGRLARHQRKAAGVGEWSGEGGRRG